MKKIVLAALAATLMLSSGAWAGFSIHVDNNKKSERRNDPPPPPPPPRERLECRFEKPDRYLLLYKKRFPFYIHSVLKQQFQKLYRYLYL